MDEQSRSVYAGGALELILIQEIPKTGAAALFATRFKNQTMHHAPVSCPSRGAVRYSFTSHVKMASSVLLWYRSIKFWSHTKLRLMVAIRKCPAPTMMSISLAGMKH